MTLFKPPSYPMPKISPIEPSSIEGCMQVEGYIAGKLQTHALPHLFHWLAIGSEVYTILCKF
jgi:hypothetical protein